MADYKASGTNTSIEENKKVSEITLTPPSISSQWLFAQPCDFVLGTETLDRLLPPGLPEFAFIGRSNVGKSSLINALVNRKNLARASNTPGRTQQLNFFDLAHKLYLVDLPGYGYAEAPKHKVEKWTLLIENYLKGRVPLKRVFLLLDSRHHLKDSDKDFMKMLDKAAVSYQLVLTKIDKIKPSALTSQIEALQIATKKNPACFPEILSTSAETRVGIDDLQQTITAFLEELF